MSYDKEKVYDLIPAIYRILDKNKKILPGSEHLDSYNDVTTPLNDLGPLESLVDIISKEIRLIEDDIFDLYENQFIETCDEWVAPYIGDLIGSTYLSNTKDLPISRKSYIANTISNRRRKGTLLVLEKIAKDVTLWDAKAVEYFKILITNQNLNHTRLDNHSTVDIRNKEQLDLINTPFDTLSHNIDVRDKAAEGFYNISNIGLFLYRTVSFPVDNASAYCHGNGQFSFNPFGLDSPLFNLPKARTKINQLNKEIDLPIPIRPLQLYKNLANYYQSTLYKENARNTILSVIADGKNIPISKVQICDLSKWKKPSEDKIVAVDPRLGRMTFNKIIPSVEEEGGEGGVEDEEEEEREESRFPTNVKVKCCYGFGSKMGGGPYLRSPYLLASFFNTKKPSYASNDKNSPSSNKEGQFTIYRISKNLKKIEKNEQPDGGHIHHTVIFKDLRSALKNWKNDDKSSGNVLFIIEDNEIYVEDNLYITIPVGQKIMISASPGKRPVIVGSFSLKNEKSGSLILDGLWITSPYKDIVSVEPGNLYSIVLRHCTLLPQLFSNDFERLVSSDHLDISQFNMKGNSPERPIFVWEKIPEDEQSCNSLVAFLKNNISNTDWIKNKDQITKEESNKNKIIIHDTHDEDNDISINLYDERKMAYVKRKKDNFKNIISLKVNKEPKVSDVLSYVYPDPQKTSVRVLGCANRYLCTWEKLDSSDTNDKDAEIFTDFIKENFAYKVKNFDLSSSAVRYVSERDDENNKVGFNAVDIPDKDNPENVFHSIKIRLLNETRERTTAELFLDGDLAFDEFIVRKDKDDMKNLLLDAGNNNLNVIVDYSIVGSFDLCQRDLVINWQNVPPMDESFDDVNNLIDFIKSFFKIDLHLYVQEKTTGEDEDFISDFIRNIFVKSSDVEITTNSQIFEDMGIKILLRQESNKQGLQDMVKFLLQDDVKNKSITYTFFSRKYAGNNMIIYYHSKNSLTMYNSIMDGYYNDYALKVNDAVIENSTVLGSSHLTRMKLGSNSIFTYPMMVKRRQEGCLRYCYIPLESFTPKKYECYPDVSDKGKNSRPGKSLFKSIRYGDPYYLQTDENLGEIFEGGENGSEMGSFHHLFQPQRLKDLEMVIKEYLRFGMKVGTFLE